MRLFWKCWHMYQDLFLPVYCCGTNRRSFGRKLLLSRFLFSDGPHRDLLWRAKPWKNPRKIPNSGESVVSLFARWTKYLWLENVSENKLITKYKYSLSSPLSRLCFSFTIPKRYITQKLARDTFFYCKMLWRIYLLIKIKHWIVLLQWEDRTRLRKVFYHITSRRIN